MDPPRHLLTVWNPSYSADAMDQHLRVLLSWARNAEAGAVEPDDVYVWWAKLRSPNRTGALPHADQVLALQRQIDSGVETHLYLSDYRSLYVAHLEEITDDDVIGETEGEHGHMPSYYHGRAADFWFRLWDIRRLVLDDTPAVIAELKKLHNTGYHDRPVSLYGGIVNLPLIVWRDDGRQWFAGSDLLTEGKLWAQRDAELRSETERVSAELRDNLLGRDVWCALESASRQFLATAEAVFRARRDDPAFDLSAAAVDYAKAVETELNALILPALRKVLAGKPPAERETRLEGWLLDLGGPVPHQSLGAIRTLLERDRTVRSSLPRALRHDAAWLMGQLPRRLEQLIELRNPAAHSDAVDRDDLGPRREEILGIGCEGLIVQIVRAKLRASF